MQITKVASSNYARLPDMEIDVRGHLVIVGANDVGKTSLLRLMNLTLGSTAQLFQQLSIADLRSATEVLAVAITFSSFNDSERAIFHREIDVEPTTGFESLVVRLEVGADPEDPASITIQRWCPGRGDTRAPSREQIGAFGWRYLPAVRSSMANQLDGSGGAMQALLKAVESDLGDEKAAMLTLLDTFNASLASSSALTGLREGMANHLSNSMPRNVSADDLAIRTAADPGSSVLENTSMYLARDGAFFPFAEQSDGIRQLASMTLFDLSEQTANVVAIDEPELHLHPASQRTVAQLLKNGVNQKILVTHSPHIVQPFDPAQVVAVGPDGSCNQIDAARPEIAERTQAHWWNPRMLEVLTARFAVLVEGVADRLIVEAAAAACGLSLDRVGAVVFELGGADNFPAVYKLLGPEGFNVAVLGLVDEAESPSWIGAIGGKPRDVLDHAIFVSKADLEDEYCHGLGPEKMVSILTAAGVANQAGILSACDVDEVEKIDPGKLARFCRSNPKSGSRKVPAALAVAKSLSKEDANSITSVTSLIRELERRTVL